MTYKQLQAAERTCDKIMNKACAIYGKKKQQYIDEHAPLVLKPGDWINIRLQVTEESRASLVPEYRNKPRYQLGYKHTVRGRFVRWLIYDNGELRPDLYGKAWYPSKEKILSITKSKTE